MGTSAVMPVYDVGSAILFEVEAQLAVPFEVDVDVDPSTLKITIYNPSDVKVVDGIDMVQKLDQEENPITGKWYYIVQTEENWPLGKYKVKIYSEHNNYRDNTVYPRNFKLV